MANVIPKSHISASAKAASVNVAAAPTSTVAGDYLVAEVTVAGVTALTSAPNSSWSLIHAAPAGSGLYHAIWAKFATSSSDGTGTWTANGANSISVTVTGYANVDTTSPVRMHTSATANGISITPPNATGLTANDEVVISTATTAGPRPWPDTGALLGCLPNGGPVVITQAAMVSFEAAANARCAVGNGWTDWTFSSPWPPAGNTTGANCDFANNRLTNLSWPTEQSWPQSGAKGTAAGDPTITFNAINNGTYDTLFAQNALKMKQYNHPMWFRPYCEMEGGDHPWEAGWVVGSASAYATAFNKAWQRLWIITKGTQAQVNALSPAYGGGSVNGGSAIKADNVLFFWNPTNTIQQAQATRDNLYPGDPYVQMAGTEAYVPDGPVNNSYAQTLDNTLTGAGGTEVPIYTYFTPGNAFSAGGKIIGHGESGNRWKGSADTSACVTRTNTFSVIQTHSGVKMFIWWNGGSAGGAGLSKIDDPTYPSAVLTAVRNFFALPYMHPTLDRTLDTPAGWSEVYQYRARLGGTDTNYGPGMSGTHTMFKTSTGSSVTAPALTGYGYADYSAITFALVPTGGGGGNVAPNSGTVTIDNVTPNYDGVHTVTLTATPSGWQGNPAIVGGDYSYQWQRVGSGNTGVVGSPNIAYGFEPSSISGSTITDNSGNNVLANAVHMPSPTLVASTTGHGKALQFNYANSQFLTIDNTSGTYDYPSWTISAWIFFDPSQGPTATGGGSRWEVMEHSQAFWVNIRGDTTPLYLIRAGGFFGGSTTLTEYDSVTALVPNTWTHIAVTYDQSNLKWYINGTLNKTQAQVGATNASTANPVVIGAKHRLSPSLLEQAYFNGAMDEFVMYNSALSGGQVASLVNSAFGSSTTNVGSNSNQYTVVAGDIASKLQVNLTVNNGVAPNGTASAITAAVTNSVSAPVNTVAPTVPASPVVGILQTATQGTWTGAQSFSYQWQQVTSNGTSNIAGATSLTYTPVPTDLAARLQIAVTAWQNLGQAGASTTVTSAASSPVTTSASVYPSYINYPTFTGLPSTADATYTSFNGVVDAASQGNTEENRAARACVRVGTTDYWGGSFTLATSPGGSQVTRTNLAAVNATNGALLSFAPTLDGAVRGLTVSPDSQYLYAVGDFTHVNGSIRNGAAKFKISDGSLDASWAPSANGSVRGVTVSPNNTTVYISGNFTTINGSSRVLVASVDNTSGALLTAFKPAFSDSLGSAQAEVRKIMFAPNDTTHVYCCGYFDTITNNSVISTRLGLAQLNVSDGSVTTWHPDLAGNTGTTIGHDMDFLSNGSAIFVAFAGSDVGGDGNTFLRYNLSPVSNTRVWAAVLDGDVNSIATNDVDVWAGTHGDGTQSTSVISNVGTRKICCVRASDGTGTVSGGQKHSLWTPSTQFDGIKGTYTIVCADNALLCGGGWANPNQAAAVFSATGATLSEFAMEVNTLSGVTLVPGASAQVAIDFTPALVGPRTATMTITDNASGSPRSVVLNGTGVTSGPVIATTPASTVDFGQVQLINTSTTATFTFTDPTPGVTFLANLDNTPFVTVTSPWTYSNLSVGTHTFFLKANNAAGDSPVATYTWVISA